MLSLHTGLKALILAAAVAQALPYSGKLTARATPHTLVPGISIGSAASPPTRKEIRTLSATELNIFYLGLEQMQALPSANMSAFYRIGGIHGTNRQWDDDDNGGADLGMGYCQHGNTYFPPWHRPYLSLYEKTLQDLAREVITGWPTGTPRDDHMAAIDNWRLPYWDWAHDASIPDAMGGTDASENVQITKFDQTSNSVIAVTSHNPLFSFRLPVTDETGISAIIQTSTPDAHTTQSVRHPIVNATDNSYISQPGSTNDAMTSQGSNLRNFVYNMFSTMKDYGPFSNQDDGRDLFSLEQVHGSVHITVGGTGQGAAQGTAQGHMSQVETAGFDPIFYLHHANVDRLFAMWQAVPDNKGWVQDGTTKMYPFRKSEDNYWTADDSKTTNAFGYTYPELLVTDKTILEQVETLYGAGTPAQGVAAAQKQAAAAPATRRRSLMKRADDATRDDKNNLHTPPQIGDLAENTNKIVNGTTPSLGDPIGGAPETHYNEYAVRVEASSNLHSAGSYQVFFFLAKPPAADQKLVDDDNFVGSFDVFTTKSTAHEMTLKGSVAMTQGLMNLVVLQKLGDMKPSTVVQYIKDNLSWKVTSGDSDVSSLKLSLLTAKVTVTAGSLPKWGPFSEIHKIQ